MVRGKTAFTATWLAVLIVGIVTYFELRDQPFFYDANSYVLAAHGIAEKGLLNNWYHAELRTYGFPVFLIGAFKVAQWLHISPTSGIFAMQWPIFVGSAWLASTSLFRSDRTRLIAFAAIAANPLLVVYVAQALTESLSLTCVLLAVAALGRAARAGRPTVRAAWLVTGATASSFAMEVRPGNLLIPVFFTLAAAGVLRWTNVKCRWPANVATAMVVSAALLVPLVPQVLVNHHNYQRLTPFPVFDLAGLQASEGVSLIRYASNVSPDCGEAALRFLNPAKPVVEIGRAHV